MLISHGENVLYALWSINSCYYFSPLFSLHILSRFFILNLVNRYWMRIYGLYLVNRSVWSMGQMFGTGQCPMTSWEWGIGYGGIQWNKDLNDFHSASHRRTFLTNRVNWVSPAASSLTISSFAFSAKDDQLLKRRFGSSSDYLRNLPNGVQQELIRVGKQMVSLRTQPLWK